MVSLSAPKIFPETSSAKNRTEVFTNEQWLTCFELATPTSLGALSVDLNSVGLG